MNDAAQAREEARRFKEAVDRLRAGIHEVVVGQDEVVDGVLMTLFCDGHALLEGVPGLAKTLLVHTLADSLSLSFSRIQFTPDLMPADIVGTMVLHEIEGGGHELRFEEGPLVASFILADEINRATPKTQSALLEAMQERTISVSRRTVRLPEPFIVLATQNPIEQEGTYPLPEAQMDRFFVKLLVDYPDESDYHEILERTTGTETQAAQCVSDAEEIMDLRRIVRKVPVPDSVRTFAIRAVMATQPGSEYAPDVINRFISLGSSPRGAQALLLGGKFKALLDGRFSVAADDIRAVAPAVLRHRLQLNFDGRAERMTTDDLLMQAVQSIPELTGTR
jgi:MoxR-like ATPase